MAGPFIPAALAKPVLKALLTALKTDRQAGETVNAWAERQGADGIAAIVNSAEPPQDDIDWHTDIGQDETFVPPATATGECAAGAMVAEHLDDLAAVAREDIARAIQTGNADAALLAAGRALVLPAKRLLAVAGQPERGDEGAVLDRIAREWPNDGDLLAALEAARHARDAFARGADGELTIAQLSAWAEEANRVVERVLALATDYLKKGAA